MSRDNPADFHSSPCDREANHLLTSTGAGLGFMLYLLRVRGHSILVTFLSFKFNLEVRGFEKPVLATCFKFSSLAV